MTAPGRRSRVTGARARLADVRLGAERRAAGIVLGSRSWLEGQVSEFAGAHVNGRVLEIGSGRIDLGEHAYSMKRHFAASCEFVQSDFNPEFGHPVVDVTAMSFDAEFDAILCISVLEHVPTFWEAIPRLHAALRPRGQLFVSVPMIFPYHDEPFDFWRMTTHGLRFLLRDFSEVDVRYRGLRRMPNTVAAIATR